MKSLKEALVHKHMDSPLSLEYKNILKSGNIVTVLEEDKLIDYIMIEKNDLNGKFFPFSDTVLLTYNDRTEYEYWYPDSFVDSFPVFDKNPRCKIVDIKKVLAKFEIRNIKTVQDLKNVFDKYHLKYEIS